MIRDAPYFGYGPGTFPLVFPFYSSSYGDKLNGIWKYAHTDHLQIVIEWGLGALLWQTLFVGALWHLGRNAVGGPRVVRTLRPSRRDSGRTLFPADLNRLATQPSVERAATYAGLFFALLGVTIHAIYDFPLQIASIQLYATTILGCAWRCKQP
jgi:O-antigen ligase